jgi:hypothetical protein
MIIKKVTDNNSSNLPGKKKKKLQKTGFNYFDDLTEEEQKLALKRHRQFWDSLTVEQRTKCFDTYYRMIREKRLEDPGRFMNMTDEDISREIVNIDLPKARRAAIEEAERNGRFDIAEDLRRRRVGVDTFAIHLFDESTGKQL